MLTTPDKSPFATTTDAAMQLVLVFAMTLPMLILYATSTLGPLLSQQLQFETASLGYLIMSSFGLAAILSLFAGNIVAYLGARTALQVLFIAVAAAFAMMAQAATFSSLVIAAALCGIAQAFANPATNLLIAQQIQPQKKAWVTGVKQSGVQLAALFAGLVLPVIAFQAGWRTAFGIIVPLAVLFAVMTAVIVPKVSAGIRQKFAFSRPNALLGWLMATQCCVALSLSAFVTFLPVYAIQQGMSLLTADKLIAVFGAMGMLSRILLTPMAAKLKDESLLLFWLIAIAACAMTITLQADSRNHWCLWMGTVGMGFTAVATNAIAMSMLIKDSAFGNVTTASGFVSVAFFSGFALGPPLYAAVTRYSGSVQFGWGMLIGIFSLACIMTVCLAVARRQCR